MESSDLLHAREPLEKARRALEDVQRSRPSEVVALLQQALVNLMKRDLVDWGLDDRNLEQIDRMVMALVVYSSREPVFRHHLQLLALVMVLEERLAFQQGESSWKAWRRDALALVNRLQKLFDPLSAVPDRRYALA